MSDDNGLFELAQELTEQWPLALAETYVALSTTVLTIFDFILTLSLEFPAIWSGKFTMTKALFIMNRYTFLAGQVLIVLLNSKSPTSNKVCKNVNYAIDILSFFTAAAINGIFVLRTFALFGKKWTVGLVLLVPALGTVSVLLWQMALSAPFALPLQFQIGPFRCQSHHDCIICVQLSRIILSWISSLLFNVLVFGMTIFRTFRLALTSRRYGSPDSLSNLLLRDGIAYYSAIFLPEILQVIISIITFKSDSVILAFVIAILGTVVDALQSIMTSRLVLNLSSYVNPEDYTLDSRNSLEQPRFASNSFLGNIGAPLSPARQVEENDEFDADECSEAGA